MGKVTSHINSSEMLSSIDLINQSRGVNADIASLSSQLAERAKSIKDFDSQKITVSDGYDYAPCINSALNSIYQYIFVPDGTYLIGSSILIPDNKRLILSYNATLVRYFTGTGSANATIRNVNQSSTTRNTNIGLFGGYVKSFDNTKTGKHIALWGVDDVKIDNIKIRDVYGDWSIHFRDCTGVIGKGIDIDTKGTDLFSDGLHITGGSKYVFSDLIIKSSDDCISLTVETAQDTNIDGVTITNAHLTTTSSSVIKMTTKTGTTPTIKNVKIKNIIGVGGTTGQGESIVIKDEDNVGRISDIEVEASVDCSNGAGVGFRLQGVNRIKGKIDIKNPQGKGADISYSNDWKLAIRVDSPRTAGVSGISLNNVDDFELTPEIINSTLHGVAVGGVGTPVTNGKIINGKTKNSTNTGIRLINAVGVDVINHRCISDVNGIIEDSGSDYNNIKNNDVRTVTTTKVSLNGANSKARENKGYITENRSTFQLNSASTSVTVAHGLAIAPSASGIDIRFRGNRGNVTKWWTANITSTNFDFVVDIAPGSIIDLSFEANAPKNI